MVDFGSLTSPQGFLKIFHVVLGAVSLGLVSYYSGAGVSNELIFFYMVSFGLLFTSFLLLLAYLFEEGDFLRKSFFEISYHLLGFIFYFSADMCLFAHVVKFVNLTGLPKDSSYYKCMITAGVFGLVNSLTYFASSFFSYKTRSG